MRLSMPATDSLTLHDLARRPHILDQLSYSDVKMLHADCREALDHLRQRLADPGKRIS
jgi:hypothetical protein